MSEQAQVLQLRKLAGYEPPATQPNQDHDLLFYQRYVQGLIEEKDFQRSELADIIIALDNFEPTQIIQRAQDLSLPIASRDDYNKLIIALADELEKPNDKQVRNAISVAKATKVVQGLDASWDDVDQMYIGLEQSIREGARMVYDVLSRDSHKSLQVKASEISDYAFLKKEGLNYLYYFTESNDLVFNLSNSRERWAKKNREGYGFSILVNHESIKIQYPKSYTSRYTNYQDRITCDNIFYISMYFKYSFPRFISNLKFEINHSRGQDELHYAKIMAQLPQIVSQMKQVGIQRAKDALNPNSWTIQPNVYIF